MVRRKTFFHTPTHAAGGCEACNNCCCKLRHHNCARTSLRRQSYLERLQGQPHKGGSGARVVATAPWGDDSTWLGWLPLVGHGAGLHLPRVRGAPCFGCRRVFGSRRFGSPLVFLAFPEAPNIRLGRRGGLPPLISLCSAPPGRMGTAARDPDRCRAQDPSRLPCRLLARSAAPLPFPPWVSKLLLFFGRGWPPPLFREFQ